MVRNFYYKLVILFLLTLGASFLILFMAILPSYFLSSVKDNIVNEKLQIQKSESIPLPDQQTLAMIKYLNNKLDLIENVQNEPRFSGRWDKLTGYKTKSVLGAGIIFQDLSSLPK